VLAWLILGETIGPWQIVGGALVVSGVGLTTQRRKQRVHLLQVD
jgi:drug/metabolite transporter (DMT)-like permease